MTQTIRVAALGHHALGTYRVKVIFRDRITAGGDNVWSDDTTAYWMDHNTYDSIPLGAEATVEDYIARGEVIRSEDNNIYSII